MHGPRLQRDGARRQRAVSLIVFHASGRPTLAPGGGADARARARAGGVASTAVLFALWRLGVPLGALRNYDGSWGEWGNFRGDDAARFPVEGGGGE